ncbi:uncharacterized protein N7515_007838 [Penicillium bovifimosum]|uniref:Uncharacterized protein n=1 Tax=Penicillium bovifimosum TaxID=126998 RepID=A0A9W9KX97_9EURO|nr:uncharacterized protein N7515_007838 [Penicillium bovifimosum]KAJ5124013.1 hypothetical protein N7515_007838 [Penicillium bovifimosum]
MSIRWSISWSVVEKSSSSLSVSACFRRRWKPALQTIRDVLDVGIARRPALGQLLDTNSLSYPESGQSAPVNPISNPRGPITTTPTTNPFAPYTPSGPVTARSIPFDPHPGPVTTPSPGNNPFGVPPLG